MIQTFKHRLDGFTLLEILLALGIMGIIAVFAIALSGSVQNAAKVGDTERRMGEIAAKAKAFYRNSESLPAGAGTGGDEVPVSSTDFNMEQKFRYDGWGTPLRYYRRTVSITVTPPGTPLTIPDIDAYSVNGKAAAGVIISNGSNQTAESTVTGVSPPFTVNTAGDDIVVPIDVSQEAVEIALDQLKVLQDKVKALDAVYEGVDNNGAGGIDETGCVAAEPKAGGTGCPPTLTLTNDPNCGTATVDEIEDNGAGQNYDCTSYTVGLVQADALGAVVEIYSLGTNFMFDPWGNAYQWGCDQTTNPGCTNDYLASDSHYHKFFSMGPNLAAGGGDDIIP